MRIRPGVRSDAEAIAEVHVASWQVGYRGQLPQDHLDGLSPAQRVPRWAAALEATSWPGRGVLLAEDDQQLLGFAELHPSDDPGDDPAAVGMVGAFYLTPHTWGQGVGRRLMTASLATLQGAGYATATLWVLDTNTRAIGFYGATGWHPDGVVKDAMFAGVLIRDLRYRQDLASWTPPAPDGRVAATQWASGTAASTEG